MIRNTVELTKWWSALTGADEKEVRQRVRVLRSAGLLPDARIEREPLTDDHIVNFLIGALASDTHIGAPDAVKRYGALRPHKDGRGIPVGKPTLAETLRALMLSRGVGSWSLMYADFNTTSPFVMLCVFLWKGESSAEDYRASYNTGSMLGENLIYVEHPIPDRMRPIERVNRFDGNLLLPFVHGMDANP